MPPTILFLGATGYVGGEVLQLLGKEYPEYPVVAMYRNITPEKKCQLETFHPKLTSVEGTLNDDDTIQDLASKADIVINVASSDHHASVKSTLAGLDKRVTADPTNPPIYIHMSGVGITSDNSRGELYAPKRVWHDVGLDLSECKGVTHVESDSDIIAADTRAENPIRTMIVCPSWIYGAGSGVQKLSMPLRMFGRFAVELGYAGTWGRGKNIMTEIHVKDVASAVVTVLKAALEKRSFEGKEGIYFAVSLRMNSLSDINRTIGDFLFAKGLIKEPGHRSLPPSIVDMFGEFGWSLLGGSQYAKGERLAMLGWKATHTDEICLLDSLREELELFVSQPELVRSPDYEGASKSL